MCRGSDAVGPGPKHFCVYTKVPELLDRCGTFDEVGDEKTVRLQLETSPVSEPAGSTFRFENVFTLFYDTHHRFIDPSKGPGGCGLIAASGTNSVVGGAGSKAVA